MTVSGDLGWTYTHKSGAKVTITGPGKDLVIEKVASQTQLDAAFD